MADDAAWELGVQKAKPSESSAILRLALNLAKGLPLLFDRLCLFLMLSCRHQCRAQLCADLHPSTTDHGLYWKQRQQRFNWIKWFFRKQRQQWFNWIKRFFRKQRQQRFNWIKRFFRKQR